jgi:hypothetical protein
VGVKRTALLGVSKSAYDPDCLETRMLRIAGAAGWLMKRSVLKARADLFCFCQAGSLTGPVLPTGAGAPHSPAYNRSVLDLDPSSVLELLRVLV